MDAAWPLTMELNWLSRLRRPKPRDSQMTGRQVSLPGWGEVWVAASVDCLGVMCPRPQLLVMKLLRRLHDGDVLEVRCDNAPAVETLPALASSLGSTHLVTLRDGAGWCTYLRKGTWDA